MNDNNGIGRIINREGLRLGLFALAVAIALTLTHNLTKNRINANNIALQNRTLTEVLPNAWQDYQIEKTPLKVFDKKTNTHRNCYIVKQNGKSIGVIINATASDGYSGNIDLLVGISLSGTITGVRVTAHSETPGLGDAIEVNKSQWIKSFDGKGLTSPVESGWTVRKHGGEFDQFTGATITPKAVTHEVKNTLQFFNAVSAELFKP